MKNENVFLPPRPLLTPGLLKKLYENGVEAAKGADSTEMMPVVKIHVPLTGIVWLLTDVVPHEPNIAFGLCDLGQGFPELGYVDLNEISAPSLTNLCAQPRRDRLFKAKKKLGEYADEARIERRVIA